jgi:hypothetical protein
MASRAGSAIAALAILLGSAAWAGADAFPGMALRERVEVHLLAQRARLAPYPAHEGLVFEIPQKRLLAFLGLLRAYPDGRDYVLGTDYAPESHGGGVLALILDYWRPAGRTARLDDRFHFEGSPRDVALADIYAGHQRQLFLPVPGHPVEDIDGALSDEPQLPRMRFRHPTSAGPVETDAYKFLGVLIGHQPDLADPWSNHAGQRLSVDLLMRNVRDVYLHDLSTTHELADHTNLHRVELLLAYHARGGEAVDPNAIKERFLANELARTRFEEEATEVVGHYVQSLGRLVADGSVTWTTEEKRRVRAWLASLDGERYANLQAVPIQHLTHLLVGLRDISRNREKLQEPDPRNRGRGE